MNVTSIPSRIADCPADYLFTGRILDRYDVQFFKCRETGFIQTEDPYWLDEAYSNVIANQDSGLLSRCYSFRTISALLINDNFTSSDECLDYGGGYGTFTRLMRDLGIRFFHHDPMCQNLFAGEFEARLDRRFALVTAFEVFEHLPDPRSTVKKILDHTDTLFFSTVLQPSPPPKSIEDWHYFLPETGQHVSFFNRTSLESLARENGCTLHTNGSSLHALSRRPISFSAAKSGFISRLRRAVFRARY